MEVATAAEPECGEGERGKFDEVLAQVDEGAVLELSEAAGFARHEKQLETARVSGDFVAAECAREVGVGLKRGCQDDGVFDGEACALAEVGADGMCRVAEDGYATDDPGKR